MFAIKLLGGALLALAGWYGGRSICGKVTAHRIVLGETITLLKVLEEEIEFRHRSLSDIYQNLAQDETFPSLGLTLLLQEGQVQSNVPIFQRLHAPTVFTKEEKAAFTDCFTRLGYTSALQECERLIRYRKQFETFHQRAMIAEQSALAVDQKIGFAIGSMVALVLL